MTALMRRRRPLPFSRIERQHFETVKAALEEQRDRAIGEGRALRDAVAAYLERAAARYEADALHLDRLKARPLEAKKYHAIAAEIRALVRDFEEELR